MNNKKDTYQKKQSHTGLGIVYGALFGLLIGLIILDGNISLGMIIGSCFGILIGAMLDIREGKKE